MHINHDLSERALKFNIFWKMYYPLPGGRNKYDCRVYRPIQPDSCGVSHSKEFDTEEEAHQWVETMLRLLLAESPAPTTPLSEAPTPRLLTRIKTNG